MSGFHRHSPYILARVEPEEHSDVKFRCIASIVALNEFCNRSVYSTLDFVFGLVRGTNTGSADEIVLSIIDSH